MPATDEDTQDSPPDYDSLLAQAAANNDFNEYHRLYQERDANMPAGGTINGVPATQVVGAGAPVEAAPSTPPSNPDKLASAIQAAQDRIKAGQPQTSPKAYDQFLASQGINPNTIGGATLVGPRFDEDGKPLAQRLEVPTRDQEQAVSDTISNQQALDAATRHAAQLALRAGNAGAYYQLMNQLRYQRGAAGSSRSSEANRAYFLQRFSSNSPYQEFYQNRSNGY